jgi:hypothetical protein
MASLNPSVVHKFGRERERITHGQGGNSFIFRESWIRTQPGPDRTVVCGAGLTSKCLRNSLHGLHYGGYKEVMDIPS